MINRFKKLNMGLCLFLLSTVTWSVPSLEASSNTGSYNNTYTEKVEEVHYNWGQSSPGPGIPADNFYAVFDQSRTFDGQEYFIQTQIDDRVHVELDGKTVIDRQKNGAYYIDRAVLGKLSGDHSIITTAYDAGGKATAYSDIVPFNSWLAYYYNNKDLKGSPINARTIAPNADGDLVDDFSTPVSKVSKDNFSVRYDTYKHLKAGDYVIRARADDGVRVFVDGKKVLDRWTLSSYREDAVKIHINDNNGSDIHQVEVQYFDNTSANKLSVSIEPYGSQLTTTSGWIGEIYPNENLTGTPVIIGGTNALNKIDGLDFNWRYGSPARNIPNDHYSAVFMKNIVLGTGSYVNFQVKADDGVRLYVDGKLVIDSWKISAMGLREKLYYLNKGQHTIKLAYYEHTGAAGLSFKMDNVFTQKAGAVHYNWGQSSPGPGIPADNFYAVFDQSRTFDGQEYFIQTQIDDRVHVELDGKTVIDRQKNGAYYIDRAVLGKLSGDHSIITTAYDAGGKATAYSDIVPFNSWLAYYYNNKDLKGSPVNARTIAPNAAGDLVEDNGYGSPIEKVAIDNFSARYVTYKHLKSGVYNITAGADDGIRVFIDGKEVLNRWTLSGYRQNTATVSLNNINGSDIHQIEVQYFEGTGFSKVTFSIVKAPVAASYKDLDLRKPSKVTATVINNYIKSRHPESPLVGYGQAFIDAQSMYGVNALYLVAHSIWESGWGKSNLAIYKHNLFGYGAYDSCPFECAYYFPSFNESIKYTAYKVRTQYLNADGKYYGGSPSLIGMNKYYATDPNWANGISSIMESIYPYNHLEYDDLIPSPIKGSAPPTPGTEIPAGQPRPPEEPTFVQYPNGIVGVTTATSLNFRKTPDSSSSANIIKTLPYNTKVAVLGENSNGWYKVNVNGTEGWVYGDYLSIMNLLKVVNVDTTLNVRQSAPYGNVLTSLKNNTLVSGILSGDKLVTESHSGTTWYKIKVSNMTGWVSGDYIKVQK